MQLIQYFTNNYCVGQMQATQTIRVLVRARPISSEVEAEDENDGFGIKIDPESSMVSFTRERKGQADFQFTRVFDHTGDQRAVYSMCNVVQDVVEGINCCIMAYGQTGSGKTYTMYGSGWEEASTLSDINNKLSKSMELKQGEGIARLDEDEASVGGVLEEGNPIAGLDEEGLGVIPRAVADLFRLLEEKSVENEKFDFSISKLFDALYKCMKTTFYC